MNLAAKVVDFAVKTLAATALFLGMCSVGYSISFYFPESYPLGLFVNVVLGFLFIPTFRHLFGDKL